MRRISESTRVDADFSFNVLNLLMDSPVSVRVPLRE